MADQADLARELLALAADDLTAARALVEAPPSTGSSDADLDPAGV